MKAADVLQAGVPARHLDLAFAALREAMHRGLTEHEFRAKLAEVAREPGRFAAHDLYGPLARAIREAPAEFHRRDKPAPYRRWGEDVDPGALQQMTNAVELPVAAAGALMPDAHQGYGLPIGGVLATRGCVIPYAVGVDIACRMKLTVLDLPVDTLAAGQDRLIGAIHRETAFGVGAAFRQRRQHGVLDEDWSVSPVTREYRDRAWSQLGTSGSGNHFVEFGTFTLDQPDLGLEPGQYLALLSHSGSRGTGAAVAGHYSKLAMNRHPELPSHLRHLAWLDLDGAAGQEYWAAMELMGKYAAANHELIHRHIARALGAEVLLDVENHHNFAWRERHFGEDVIVHRKGATPAAAGVLGVIPGSMADPGFLVRGRGQPDSMNSAAHGAGRRMSRTQAFKQFTWEDAKRALERGGVKLLSAGLDEVPMAYKNIREVMAAQADLVEVIARFDPRLVKMAPSGERPED
jgi:tRNA-splicing ligase RtcB (3'-phosphate/5'-hydroxy nucleic acid ligase)